MLLSPRSYMGFKLTNSKETALRAFIVEWVKSNEVYCNYCGWKHQEVPEGCEPIICCDKPQYGTNAQFLRAIIEQNKDVRETRANDFASNKDKTFRLGISMTPRLLHDLEEYSINTLKEPLLKDAREMNDFMRSFPELCIPERV